MITSIFEKLPIPDITKIHHYYRYIIFIDSRLQRNLSLDEQYEVHHIIPKSMGGEDISSNKIKLSLREHYIAHLILSKCGYPSMVYAFSFMLSSNKYGKRLTSREYSNLKKEILLLLSNAMKGENNPTFKNPLVGEKNGMFGKHLSEETKEKIRKASIGKKRKAHTKEQNQRMSEFWKGKKYEDVMGVEKAKEVKEKMSRDRKGRKKSEEHKRKLSISNKGKHFREYQPRSEEYKEKIRGEKNPFYGKTHSDETKKKLSLIRKGRIWLHHPIRNLRTQIDKEKLEEYIKDGWVRGMGFIGKEE